MNRSANWNDIPKGHWRVNIGTLKPLPGLILLLLLGAASLEPAVIGAPQGVSASATSPSKTSLRWIYAGNVGGFLIERSRNADAGFTQIADVRGSRERGYADSGLYAETGYYYRVRAYKGANRSAYSVVAGIVTQPLQVPIVAAGMDQSLYQFPVANLRGAVVVDGIRPTDVLAYQWSMVSGPGQAVFTQPLSLTTDVTFPVSGHYELRLTVTVTTLAGKRLTGIAAA